MKKRLTALILALAMVVTGFAVPVSAEEDTDDVQQSAVTDTADEQPQPRELRAAVITPSVDYFTGNAPLSDELDALYAKFGEMGLNAVVINTVYNGVTYCETDPNASGEDPVLAAVEQAYGSGISPTVVYDMSACVAGTIDGLVSKVHRFALKYSCDCIVLDGYYVKRGADSYAEYMRNGSGVGYTNWLYDKSEQYFRTAAEVIRETDSSIRVGIMINDMWANDNVDPFGSATKDPFQAYYDGFTDTRAFIKSGYADCAMVRAYGSVTSPTLPFEEVTGWWGKLTDESGIPLYIVHHNEYLGTATAGWGGQDQLIQQLDAAEKISSYSGSVFNSFAALEKDPLGSTSALVAFYREHSLGDEAAETEEASDTPAPEEPGYTPAVPEGEVTEPEPEPVPIPKDLKMTSPSSLTYTTTEASVTFMGSFDENEPVYFNGSELKVNLAGNIYFEQPLEAGLNTFTISHKDKQYTYSITRKITVLKGIGTSISEGKSLAVDGGTKIKLTARAYKGANVYGTINGVNVNMKEVTSTDEEESNSSYARFTGTYTAPAGIVGKTQQLGIIKITASYAGYTMSAAGASVTVNAKPEPVVKKEAVTVKEETTAGSGEVIASLEAPHGADETLKYVKITADNTIVYDGKTADDIPSPLFSQLPAGALEVYRSTSGSYYVTESGKRIAMSTASLEDGKAITQNALLVRSIGTSNGNSYIKIQMEHKTGFNMRLAGNTYYTAWDGDYNVGDFKATHLYITFENVTSVTSLPSFEHNQVFKSGKWDTVTEENGTKFRLILELRQPGVYFGHGARYDAEGCLILSFPVPVNSLSGLTVVIDPGHGYGKSATTIDPGAIGEVVEQEVVLDIAKELTAQLQAAGANVIRLKTESEYLLTKERPNVARGYGCDIFLSIHANKAWGASSGVARGAEAYYFTSYSQPLAADISSAISAYYKNNVYTDGADKDRGAKYSYYHVTLQQDFPSILIETGFVDNIQDASGLASPAHQKGIAAAIVSGIKSYIARSGISYATDGYSAAASISQQTTPAQTTAAVTTAAPVTSAVTEVSAETTADTSETPDTEDTEAPEDAPEYDEETTEDTEPPEPEYDDEGGGDDTDADTTKPPSTGLPDTSGDLAEWDNNDDIDDLEDEE